VEQLLTSPPSGFPKPLLALLIILPLLAIAAGAVYYFFFRLPSEPVSAAPTVQGPTEYVLEDLFLERRFYRGDTILIPMGDEQFRIELADLGEVLTLSAPDGEVTLDLSQDTELDLNGDGVLDIQITLSDFDKNSPTAGALIRFDLNNSFSPPALTQSGAAAVPGQAAAPRSPNTVIFSSTNAWPFTLQAVFQGYCMFRWEIDRRDRNERYFVRADELNMQAQNGIRLWVSNATAVKLQVMGAGRTVPLDIGNAGEVVVVDIRWLRDNDGRYRLSQYRLE
jgi:hypothetical protein